MYTIVSEVCNTHTMKPSSTAWAITRLGHLRRLPYNSLRRWQISQDVYHVVEKMASQTPGKGCGEAKSADDCPLRKRCGELKSEFSSSEQFNTPGRFEAFKTALRMVGHFDGKMELLLHLADALMITVYENLDDKRTPERMRKIIERARAIAIVTVANAYDALCGACGEV